jgi:hypothetical protein
LIPRGTDAVAGVTESAIKTAGVTVNRAEPVIAPDLALIVVDPWARLVANPPLLTFATEVVEEFHPTELVRFWVLPLL